MFVFQANCIVNTEAKAAFKMFEELYKVLHERAIEAACGSGVKTLPLDQEQATQILVEKTQQVSLYFKLYILWTKI